MEISTKENGSMVSLMDKATIFIMATKVCIKGTGKMAKRKDLVSLLLMTNTVILESGRIIRNMEEEVISTRMAKDTKEHGSKIKRMERELINTKMVISSKATGRTIEDRVKEP